MPSRRQRRNDFDFEIHVDPSCTSTEMDGGNHSRVEESIPLARDDHYDDNDAGRQSFSSDVMTENSSLEPNWVSHLDVGEHGAESDETDVTVLESIEVAVAEHDEDHDESASRRESAVSLLSERGEDEERRTSGRTEAMIQAAARDIVAQMGERTGSPRHSRRSGAASDHSYSSTWSSRPSLSNASDSRLSGGASEQHHQHQQQQHTTGDEGGDSSSHHEHEDDVFSDNSPRSSIGSVSEADQLKMEEHGGATRSRTTTARISDLQSYDPEEAFVPTIRGTPRPPFRSPSSVKAMQMTSPPPSVLGSPRSSKRTPRQSTMSRLGSPSTQFSPKKTPPRFKRNTPPLVLLHVTLLPLRWPWGEFLDSVRGSELSEAGKALRESWRVLQDRLGDTVSDRGVLLPHPQNDFEVLEERLLEAMELPLRRRARILECGHYIGPANELSLLDEMESEDDEDQDQRQTSEFKRTHWCRTCQSDIRYDSLGESKVFRCKVYASNGLMRAGAWDACWKQMERVDVELEPIVDTAVLDELELLVAEHEKMVLEDEADHVVPEEEEEHSMYADQGSRRKATDFMSSSPRNLDYESTPLSAERRLRDEERLREIYGQSPPPPLPQTAPVSTERPRPEDFIAQETPPSPTVEALERRESRRQTYKSSSLPELALEALKVLLRDKKNAVIGLLGLVVMMLAVRGGQPSRGVGDYQPPVQEFSEYQSSAKEQNEQTMMMPVMQESLGGADAVEDGGDFANPCELCEVALEEAKASLRHVVPLTVTVTETFTTTAMVAAASPTMDDIAGEAALMEDAMVMDSGHEEL